MKKEITKYSVIFFLCLTSCKITEKNIVGTYVLDEVPKTRIILNADKSFKFIRINENPYLYCVHHPEDAFFITQGQWELKNKSLFLTSTKDSLIYPLANVEFDTSKKLEYSTFGFYDLYNDSTGACSVEHPDGGTTILAEPRKLFYSYSVNFKKEDSLTFEFYGYKYWRIVSKNKRNENIKVQLIPQYAANYFQHAFFQIKHTEIIQEKKNKKYKFKKKKNAIPVVSWNVKS